MKEGWPHLKGNTKTGPVQNVTIRLNQVGPAVAVQINGRNPETKDASCGHGQPELVRAIDKGSRRMCLRPKSGGRAVVKIRNDQVSQAVAIRVTGGNPHAGQCAALTVAGNARLFADLLKAELALIGKEPARCPVVGNVDIRAVVAGDLGNHDPQPTALRQVDSGRPRKIRKGAVTVIAVKPIGLGREVLRAAVIAPAIGGGGSGADFGS